MKFSVVALVVLALAIGSESFSLVKREAPELEKLTQHFKELSESLSRAAQDMVEKVQGHELAGQAQTYIDSGKAQFQPIVEKIKEHLEQLKPQMESVQTQMQPWADTFQEKFQSLLQQAMDQIKALPAATSQ